MTGKTWSDVWPMLEPTCLMGEGAQVAQGMAHLRLEASIAVSLKRIADNTDKIAAELKKIRKNEQGD